jgi:two-component system sensor histidine kinase/response regulator
MTLQQRTIRFWLKCLVIGCLLPATLGFALILAISYQQQRSGIERHTVATARALMQAVDAELYGPQSALQILAASQRLSSGDLAGFYRQASDALPNVGGNYISVTDSTGQELLNTLRPFGEPLPRDSLSSRTRQVFETGKPTISDLFTVPTSGASAISLEVPVFSGGKVAHTLAMGIFADRLGEFLRQQNLPPDWIAEIFDSGGTIAARTHGADHFVGGTGSSSLLRRTADVSEGVTTAESPEGIPIWTAFNRSPRSGWAIGIGIPRASLTGNLWRPLGFGAAVMLVLLTLSGWMARAIGIKISRSIRSLHTAALALGTPELLSIPVSEIVEVNDVSRTLMDVSRSIGERVVEREQGELAARAMVAAKHSADDASRATSEFLASMSHEVRTPLNAISGFAQLLSQSGQVLGPEQRTRYAASILEASVRLGKIIDDVLDMASSEAGHVDVNCEVLDCLEIMTEVNRAIEVSARKSGIMFTVDTSGNLPSIVADRRRLIQILRNVASNAIQYNVESGWVLMTAIPYGDVVRFVVRDTGKGIAAALHGEVFQPFNRLGAELTEEEGTGLGLTISRRFVEAMNGKIGFESAQGEGSKFWVEMPVASEAAAETRRVPSLFAAMADTRRTILYIEDKLPNVELMRAIIEDLNNTRFIDAQTVKEGLRIARSVKPDLVITDIHLPDGKGFDVLRGLRHDSRTEQIPVIALTADAMSTNLHNMALAGFNHILTKPFQIQDLLNIVQARLEAA